MDEEKKEKVGVRDAFLGISMAALSLVEPNVETALRFEAETYPETPDAQECEDMADLLKDSMDIMTDFFEKKQEQEEISHEEKIDSFNRAGAYYDSPPNPESPEEKENDPPENPEETGDGETVSTTGEDVEGSETTDYSEGRIIDPASQAWIDEREKIGQDFLERNGQIDFPTLEEYLDKNGAGETEHEEETMLPELPEITIDEEMPDHSPESNGRDEVEPEHIEAPVPPPVEDDRIR